MKQFGFQPCQYGGQGQFGDLNDKVIAGLFFRRNNRSNILFGRKLYKGSGITAAPPSFSTVLTCKIFNGC